jgi:hypothetical protein
MWNYLHRISLNCPSKVGAIFSNEIPNIF